MALSGCTRLSTSRKVQARLRRRRHLPMPGPTRTARRVRLWVRRMLRNPISKRTCTWTSATCQMASSSFFPTRPSKRVKHETRRLIREDRSLARIAGDERGSAVPVRIQLLPIWGVLLCGSVMVASAYATNTTCSGLVLFVAERSHYSRTCKIRSSTCPRTLSSQCHRVSCSSSR
jgi:hypothetical protein